MLDLLRRNPMFRRLWLAQVVSQAGDWLSRIAILTVIGELGGGAAVAGAGALYGIEMAVRMVPGAAVAPIAGPLADRLPRRTLMITTDLLRAVVVLGFLLIDSPEHLPYLYLLLVLQMSISVFFETAHSASTASTVAKRDLHTAYALSAATWSSMLTLGALIGGILVRFAGVSAVFVIDACSYLVSAAILLGLTLPPAPEHPEPLRIRDLFLFRDLRRGITYVRRLGIWPIIATKSFWGTAAGYLVLLSIAGSHRFADEVATGSSAESTAAAAGFATGMLYTARGLGTGLGPIIARRLLGSTEKALHTQIGIAFLVASAGYTLFALAPSLGYAMAAVCIAHMGGSVIWVAATTWWQQRIEDDYRGRVFSLEITGMTLSFAFFALAGGFLYDATGSLETTLWVLSFFLALQGGVWYLLARQVVRDS